MRLLVIGGWGQLGSDLASTAAARGHEVLRPTHAELDVTDWGGVRGAVARSGADIVVNAAAFHRTDVCEAEPQAAFAVNAVGALNVARAARAASARSVFVSTDYVFDGENPRGYREDDRANPVNVYGVSKAAGERLVSLSDPAALVVRGSGLFGHSGSSGKGGNFVESMLARARAGEPISVVTDFVFSPTSTRDMAERLLMLLELGAPPGSYHLTNAGSCSWYEFAAKILELAGLRADLTPRTEADPAVRRPRCTILIDTKTADVGLPPARAWEEALTWYLHERTTSEQGAW